MIEIRKIKKSFGTQMVLDGIDLNFRKGKIHFVIGRSGTGKSVLLKLIVGLLKPDSGELWIEKKEITKLPEESLIEVRRSCGMVFQFAALLDSLTVFENVAFGLRALKYDPKKIDSLVIEKLLLVHITKEYFDQFPHSISMGMQKRVSIARTLALSPACLLFDEPTTALDPILTRALNGLILELSKKLNTTSVVVSHDMHCALEIADTIHLLDQGRVVAEGSPQELLISDEPLVREFLSEAKKNPYA